jgi:hypothetical protein
VSAVVRLYSVACTEGSRQLILCLVRHMIVAAAVVISIAFGVFMGYWHRGLMVQLHAAHPHVWQRLENEGTTARMSMRYPLWTHQSVFFFVAKHYESIGDPSSSARAARFRLAVLLWLFAVVATAIMLFWLAPNA